MLNEFVDGPNASSQAATLLKPAFDALAQAAGLQKSPNYDKKGERVKK